MFFCLGRFAQVSLLRFFLDYEALKPFERYPALASKAYAGEFPLVEPAAYGRNVYAKA